MARAKDGYIEMRHDSAIDRKQSECLADPERRAGSGAARFTTIIGRQARISPVYWTISRLARVT